MKLDFVEACGFRGFREKVRVDFGGGFTIISGRNGVGKSTLCDAIEFALTGTIDKYAVEKAAQESLGSYFWWRGTNSASAHYVTVRFSDGNGQSLTITRTREKGATASAAEIESALCSTAKPEDAIQQLCRTSIVRDERIAALSLDLSETDRFELVRAALGPVEGADYGAKAKEMVAYAADALQKKEGAYQAAREKLTDALAQLSVAKDAATRVGNVAEAMSTMNTLLPGGGSDVRDLLRGGRTESERKRIYLQNAGEGAMRAREVLLAQKAYSSPEALKRRADASAALDRARAKVSEANAALQRAQQEASSKDASNAVAMSLASLVEHGRKLGLHDETCPLCAASRSPAEFERGLAAATVRVEALVSGISAARQALDAARKTALITSSELAVAEKVLSDLVSQEPRLRTMEQDVIEVFDRGGLDHRFVNDPEGLEVEISKERDRLINLERALRTLEVSHTVSNVSSLEERSKALRLEADQAAKEVERSQTALESAQTIEKNVRRVTAEIIDERLALISPLLNELYERLRPHADWRTIEYSIRGDIKRFLTLRVGDGLNPQFVFSSGQRRAAGLAFLLSVHLARTWSRWNTLVLDDPVQHIDDFRALHLAEVLSAIRASGRQIVCAVEDAALADLLCRRLSSVAADGGVRYDIEPGNDGSTAVALRSEVPPMPVGVLRRSAGMKTAG